MSDEIRVEHSAKRVRTYLGGQLIADTSAPLLVWEKPYYPTYYLPLADVSADVLTEEDGTSQVDGFGEAHRYTVRGGGREAAGAAVRYPDSPVAELREAVRLEWPAMDSWFEEDLEVFGHPRSPYTRIDALPSSRRVRVLLDGVVIADSTSPTLLFETGLRTRYYLPKPHVRMDLLTHTDTVTHCPYKGHAEYWSVNTGEQTHTDLAWSYATPLPESRPVAGLIAFPQERVTIEVDGRTE
jgi:uncharacterized protein (DUF427 family)